ncbi:MAG: hypothetical protein WA621_19610 [Candidatus Acidiferrum sp.]
MKFATLVHALAFACSVAVVLVEGCAANRVSAPAPVATERRAALDARTTGRVGPADIYPDLSITPGVAAPDVTPDNINKTICVAGFTAAPRRPPSSYTDKLKVKGFGDYGLADRKKGDYEEDHLISLELGGDPKDPNNLWPEPYSASIPDGGARYKDKVEKYLNGQVCQGKMTLADAQKAIVADWYQVYQSMPKK